MAAGARMAASRGDGEPMNKPPALQPRMGARRAGPDRLHPVIGDRGPAPVSLLIRRRGADVSIRLRNARAGASPVDSSTLAPVGWSRVTVSPGPCRVAAVKRERGTRPVHRYDGPQSRGCPRNCKRRASPRKPLPATAGRRRRRATGLSRAASQETCRHVSPITRAGRAGERTTVVATILVCRELGVAPVMSAKGPAKQASSN
jgi:hypothetical protein